MPRRVCIVRLGWFLGSRLAQRLEAHPDVEYVCGIDVAPPFVDVEPTEFIRADIRRPVILKILDAARIDTVVHLGLWSAPREAGGLAAMHDLNVIGAMQVFAACQRSSTVTKLVVRSSTAVYGADAAEPAIFTEDMHRSTPRDPFGRDCAEMEDYLGATRRRRPELDISVLRFANILGPDSDTPLSEYLSMRFLPTIAGFDPRMQFFHSEDALELLVRAVVDGRPGIFNATTDDVVYLSQAIRLGGRIQVPLPPQLLKALGSRSLRRMPIGLQIPPHILGLLRWGRVADNRKLKEEFGFRPSWTSGATVRDFFADRMLGRIIPGAGDRRDVEVERFVERKKREHEDARR